MFTGLIKQISPVLKTKKRQGILEIILGNPLQNAQTGESVAVDGICLTLEKITPQEMSFALGFDTLQTTTWDSNSLENKKMNIEPSLKVDDLIGGGWVTGHIDGIALIEDAFSQGDNHFLIACFPKEIHPFIWKKGFITLNGVSLTIHEVIEKNKIRVGIIPETLKRTNLKDLKKGSQVTFEVCAMARGLIHYLKSINLFPEAKKKIK